MTLNIGRKQWVGLSLQSGFQVPAVVADYAPFQDDSMHSVQEQIKVNHGYSYRDSTLSSVAGKNYSEGNLDMIVDNKFAGYLLVGAMGSVATVNTVGSIYTHTITRNNSNTPQYLTMILDRGGIDRQYYPDIAVSELDLEVGTDLATIKSKLIGNAPTTTASGTITTSSGNVFSFRNASFAFGATVSAAGSATNLKPHDFKLHIKNNSETVFGHGQGTPRSINHKDFKVTAEFMLYFENTTDRDAYYNQTKQAAVFKLTGNNIGNSTAESLAVNMYQTSVESFEIDTGLDNFLAEKVTLSCEWDNANSKTIDMVLVNNKSLYI